MSRRPELPHIAPRLVQGMPQLLLILTGLTQGTFKHPSAAVPQCGCTPRGCSVVVPSQEGLPAAAGGTGVGSVPLMVRPGRKVPA